MSNSRRTLLTAALTLPATAAVVGLTSGTAHAAAYSWDRTLKEGLSGDDVKQLQIRVSGYPGKGKVLAIDGVFGSHTTTAVAGFQKAYGLKKNGVADSKTFDKIYALQSDDNTPVHFKYSELNSCNSDWSGGKLSAKEAKFNALVTMWKLEALRRAMGDKGIKISSGFRSESCNADAGGASNSRHMYGDAADLVGTHSLCDLAKQARYHGFSKIFGPGYPNHNDHTHVSGGSQRWSAPDCGI